MPSRLFTLASPVCLNCGFFVRSKGRFFVPTWFLSGAARRRGQDWPKATAAGAREAVLRAAARGARLAGVGARLIVSPAAEILLADHHCPTDARHLAGGRSRPQG